MGSRGQHLSFCRFFSLQPLLIYICLIQSGDTKIRSYLDLQKPSVDYILGAVKDIDALMVHMKETTDDEQKVLRHYWRLRSLKIIEESMSLLIDYCLAHAGDMINRYGAADTAPAARHDQ